MDDLLKEAIADAKAVRETALENAKMALEEAFTPRLQNMLSQKIQSEIEDEDGEEMEDEMAMNDEDEDPSDEDSMDAPVDDEAPMDDEEEDVAEVSVNEEDIIEIDGVKYAPVVSEEDEEDMGDEEMGDEDEMEESDDLDLEAVIKELESELDEQDEEDEVDESKEEVDEQSNSSGIGKGTGVKAASAGDEEDPGKGKLKEGEDKDEEEVDEDIDLDEVLAALSEEEDEEEVDEVAKLQSDLDEHRSVIETLRGKLNEVNLLNAKLLFTNKLFRKHGLNNEQKMKVVEQFDRASNLREVKLVYSTLGESFGARKNEINEHKGSASKPIASTKPEKEVITEGSDLRDRFKKLANLI